MQKRSSGVSRRDLLKVGGFTLSLGAAKGVVAKSTSRLLADSKGNRAVVVGGG